MGRIFGLTDAVFAIAMTLLALDLRVPDVGRDPSESVLRRALGAQGASYVAFLLSFYVIANYWRRHHRLMRTVRASDGRLIRLTIVLLLAISAMPFAAELLGTYGGSAPIVILIYSLTGAVAVGALLLIDHELAARALSSDGRSSGIGPELWCDLVALLLAGPVAYALPRHGLLALVVLMTISGRTAHFIGKRRARQAAAIPAEAIPMEAMAMPAMEAIGAVAAPGPSTGADRNRRRRFGSGSMGMIRSWQHR